MFDDYDETFHANNSVVIFHRKALDARLTNTTKHRSQVDLKRVVVDKISLGLHQLQRA